MSFAALHRSGSPLLLPNVWDVAMARFLVAAGFAALGTTSLGVAAAAGRPDNDAGTGPQTLRLVRRLSVLPVPVTADLGVGTVAAALAAAEAGAAGVNVEDAMGDTHTHAALIRAIKREAPQLFVNARTDTHWLRRGDLAETLRRAHSYVEAGADGVFVPGLVEPAEITVVVSAVDVPVNVLFAPGRHTVASLASLGVRRISMGSLLFRAALAAAVETALAVRDDRPIRTDLPVYQEVAQTGIS